MTISVNKMDKSELKRNCWFCDNKCSTFVAICTECNERKRFNSKVSIQPRNNYYTLSINKAIQRTTMC